MTYQPGTLVKLSTNQDATYQVLNIDRANHNCWVRRWPLSAAGSPVFTVSTQNLVVIKSGHS